MSKQSNSAPEKSSTPASSGSGGPSPIKTIRKISNGGSVHPTPVGPKNAPFVTK